MGCDCSKPKHEQKLIQDAINTGSIYLKKQTHEIHSDEDSIDSESHKIESIEQNITPKTDQISKPDDIHQPNNITNTDNIHINQPDIGEIPCASSSVRLTDMKSTLSTRNCYTGRSIDILSETHRKDLCDSDLNYLCWEQKYIQKRFHPKQYLQQMRENRREILGKQMQNSTHSPTHYDEILKQEEERDIELQKRFNNFVEKHNGDKPVLVLDVDNTMIYVRFFSDEMKVGDIVTYFESEYVSKNNSKVIELRLNLSLEINDSRLIDIVGSENIQHEYWTNNNDDLKKYKKNSIFEYKLEGNDLVECKIRMVEVTGCKIETFLNESNTASNNIHLVDFTVADGSGNLNKLEPSFERTGMVPVHFIYEGFLVRLRPNLDEFLEYISDDFDVVIYTSAYKMVYEGLLMRLHEYIKEQLGRQDETDLYLWSDVLYRDDCTLSYTENNKPFHHKDLTLFGCDLSRLIMVDNSPIVCHGQEPNFILIKDYFGKDQSDDELMGKIYQILDPIVEIKGDIRYHLCGLNIDYDNHSIFDISTEDSCILLTENFMQQLDVFYDHKYAQISTPKENGEYSMKKKESLVMLDGYTDTSESILSSSTINSEKMESDEDEYKNRRIIDCPSLRKSQSARASLSNMAPIDFKRNKSLLANNKNEKIRRHSRFSSMGTYIYGVHSLYSHDIEDTDNEEEQHDEMEFNALYHVHRSKSTLAISRLLLGNEISNQSYGSEKQRNQPSLYLSKSLNVYPMRRFSK